MVQLVKLTNGTNNDTAPGLHLRAGTDTVTWTYQVTNTGGETLNNILVKDDNGTPGNTSDDFTVGTFSSLAAGSSTTLTHADGLAIVGQYKNIATATGTGAVTGQTATSSNPDNYFGDVPSITLVKLTNGTDNNTAPGLHLRAGTDQVTWTYQVTNVGNVTLSNVLVTDNNGTPGNTSDDFTVGTIPTLAAGASTTLTKAGGAAVTGQYTNLGTATGTDTNTLQTVTATNPDNYFGDLPSVTIVKLTNGTDNNTAPGLHVAAGSTAMTDSSRDRRAGDCPAARDPSC